MGTMLCPYRPTRAGSMRGSAATVLIRLSRSYA
jgi:hypothetical protein